MWIKSLHNSIGLILIILFSVSCASRKYVSTNPSDMETTELPSGSDGKGLVGSDHAADSLKIENVIAEAEKYLGTPYCFGGTGMECFDCSGFVMTMFRSVGMEMPRMCGAMAELGSPVHSMEELQRGDLVFFTKTFQTSETVTHVGICTGPMQMIHASSSPKGIMYANLTYDYWKKHFLFGRRVF